MGQGNEVGMRVYECSGLRIASEIPLPGRCIEDQNPLGVDLTIRRGEARTSPFERPSVDVVAELIENGLHREQRCLRVQRIENGFHQDQIEFPP